MFLTKFEMELLAKLLDMAAEEFSNHCCNDFEVENTPEARRFMIGAETWNSPEEYAEYGLHLSKDEKTIYTQDSFLMSYFADRLQEESERQARISEGGRVDSSVPYIIGDRFLEQYEMFEPSPSFTVNFTNEKKQDNDEEV